MGFSNQVMDNRLDEVGPRPSDMRAIGRATPEFQMAGEAIEPRSACDGWLGWVRMDGK